MSDGAEGGQEARVTPSDPCGMLGAAALSAPIGTAALRMRRHLAQLSMSHMWLGLLTCSYLRTVWVAAM